MRTVAPRLSRKFNAAGFTLIEILIGFVVTSILAWLTMDLITRKSKSDHALALKMNTQSLMSEFLQARKTALANSQGAATYLNSNDASLPLDQQVWRGFLVNRKIPGPNGTFNQFAETVQTTCVPAPTEPPLNNGMNECLVCPDGQMPRITVTTPGSNLVFPHGTGAPGETIPFAAALCLRRNSAGDTLGLRLQTLVRNAEGMSDVVQMDIALPAPAASGDAVKVYGSHQAY